MNREVHVRFWERPRVKVPRATRQSLPKLAFPGMSAFPPLATIERDIQEVRRVPTSDIADAVLLNLPPT
jgi:hypothetical protein